MQWGFILYVLKPIQQTTSVREEQEERSIHCNTEELALKAANIINQAYAEYKACE